MEGGSGLEVAPRELSCWPCIGTGAGFGVGAGAVAKGRAASGSDTRAHSRTGSGSEAEPASGFAADWVQELVMEMPLAPEMAQCWSWRAPVAAQGR